MDLNKAMIIGRITQDLDMRTTPNGHNVVSFSVATNRRWTDSAGTKQEQVEFHNVVFWGKLAEIANQYLSKGKQVYIEGRLETKTWEAQDGTKRYKTEIIGEQMQMLGGKDSSDSNSNTSNTETKAPAAKTAAPTEEEISVEDIPF